MCIRDRYYAVHNDCKLKESATQPVYEIDPPSSGILFIGEAPGRNEDLQGRPFVGAAGKFLDELLQIIGLTREEVYVTNICLLYTSYILTKTYSLERVLISSYVPAVSNSF